MRVKVKLKRGIGKSFVSVVRKRTRYCRAIMTASKLKNTMSTYVKKGFLYGRTMAVITPKVTNAVIRDVYALGTVFAKSKIPNITNLNMK